MNEKIDNFSIFPELNNELSEEKEEYLKYSEIFLKILKMKIKRIIILFQTIIIYLIFY